METVIRTTTHASEIQFLVSLLTNAPEQTPEFIEAFKSGNEIAFPYGEDGILGNDAHHHDDTRIAAHIERNTRQPQSQ